MLKLLGSAYILSANLLLALTHAADTQGCFARSAVIGAPINAYAYVGYANMHDVGYATHPTSPTIRMVRGGSVSSGMSVFHRSTFNLSGGSIGNDLKAHDSSIVSMSGGIIGNDLSAQDKSAVNIWGGRIKGSLSSEDSSTVNVRGGGIGGNVCACGHSSLHLFGAGLTKTLLSRNVRGKSDFNVFVVTGENNGVTYNTYTLHGRLADGTSVNGKLLYVEKNALVTLHNTSRSASLADYMGRGEPVRIKRVIAQSYMGGATKAYLFERKPHSLRNGGYAIGMTVKP